MVENKILENEQLSDDELDKVSGGTLDEQKEIVSALTAAKAGSSEFGERAGYNKSLEKWRFETVRMYRLQYVLSYAKS